MRTTTRGGDKPHEDKGVSHMRIYIDFNLTGHVICVNDALIIAKCIIF